MEALSRLHVRNLVWSFGARMKLEWAGYDLSISSIGVQVSELIEKACTDSTGRPGDPDSKFLKNAKVHLTVKNIVFDSKNLFYL